MTIDIEESDWFFAAKEIEIEEEEVKVVQVLDRQIGLCRFEDRIYAFDNICSHEDACLSDGIVDGDRIECPLHQARFCIRTGEYLSAPATADIEVFPVRQIGESVYVQVKLASLT
ncbi:MAG: non-heme iron oxygenase ferredoxin subunit [Proteobacteria bacterium]|nr:non-heme iron oxygenase ferredoxin subunit [Pseudomonadota bacterium]